MSQSTRPAQPREAVVLDTARKRARISAREAARQAGMSDSRWRQIISGYQTVGGTHVPVRAPDETLARMAQVVGVTADELTEAGRADAAQALRDLPDTTVQAGSPPPVDAVYAIMASLPPDAQDEVIRRLGLQATRSPEGQDRHAG